MSNPETRYATSLSYYNRHQLHQSEYDNYGDHISSCDLDEQMQDHSDFEPGSSMDESSPEIKFTRRIRRMSNSIPDEEEDTSNDYQNQTHTSTFAHSERFEGHPVNLMKSKSEGSIGGLAGMPHIKRSSSQKNSKRQKSNSFHASERNHSSKANTLGGNVYNTRPNLSYVELITESLAHSEDGLLSLQEIYESIKSRYPFFKSADPAWQNSIRHNLSVHDTFKKIPRPDDRPGKGFLWASTKVNGDKDPGSLKTIRKAKFTNTSSLSSSFSHSSNTRRRSRMKLKRETSPDFRMDHDQEENSHDHVSFNNSNGTDDDDDEDYNYRYTKKNNVNYIESDGNNDEDDEDEIAYSRESGSPPPIGQDVHLLNGLHEHATSNHSEYVSPGAINPDFLSSNLLQTDIDRAAEKTIRMPHSSGVPYKDNYYSSNFYDVQNHLNHTGLHRYLESYNRPGHYISSKSFERDPQFPHSHHHHHHHHHSHHHPHHHPHHHLRHHFHSPHWSLPVSESYPGTSPRILKLLVDDEMNNGGLQESGVQSIGNDNNNSNNNGNENSSKGHYVLPYHQTLFPGNGQSTNENSAT